MTLNQWLEGFQFAGATLTMLGGFFVFARWAHRSRLTLRTSGIRRTASGHAAHIALARRGRSHDSQFDLTLSFFGPGRRDMRQHVVLESTDRGQRIQVYSAQPKLRAGRQFSERKGHCQFDMAGSEQISLVIPLGALVDVDPPRDEYDGPEYHPWTGYARLEARNQTRTWLRVWVIKLHADVQEPTGYDPQTQEMTLSAPEHEAHVVRWFNFKDRRQLTRIANPRHRGKKA